MSTTASAIGKPVYRAPLVNSAGLLTQEWLPWFEQVFSAGATVASAQSALTALQASLASDEKNLATLQGQVTAAGNAMTAAQAALASIEAALAAVKAFDQSQIVALSALTARVATLEQTPAAAGTPAIRTVTAAATFTAADGTICGDATAGAFTVLLEAAPSTGQIHTLKKIDASANAIDLDGNGKPIDGYTAVALVASGMSLTVEYDGTAWRIE